MNEAKDEPQGIFRLLQEEIQWKEPSTESVPGMGLFASEEATRWAYIGYLWEKKHFVEALSKPRAGRPLKSKLDSKDAFRAFSVWKVANFLRSAGHQIPSNRRLIEIVEFLSEHHAIPNAERPFPPGGNYESSVSRGKKTLDIDTNWVSSVCEELDKL